MNSSTLFRNILLAASLCEGIAPSFAQGPLAPPGPPGPTFRTLHQVEPRTPIGALPFAITTPGSYYLTTNVNGGAGITISSSGVALDLMGFELAGGTGGGITVSGARSNLWIRNGTVRGWPGWGVDAASGHESVFENLILSGNGLPSAAGGLRVGGASVARRCSSGGNGTAGIQVSGNRSRVEANHLILNARGLHVTGADNVIIHNSALGNTVDFDVAPGNDLGPVGRAATLASPWGNIASPPFDLTVVRAGTGSGAVTSSPTGINCGMDCTEAYSPGTTVNLTATPDAGSTFAGWSGGGCSGTGPCVVTMNAANTVTATFTASIYTLTVTRAGAGTGTITSSPAGINCGVDCTEGYTAGTMVTLTAAPAVGSTFTGWSGGGCSGTGPCVVTVSAATTVTATFALGTHTLTVTRAGTGTGTITSSPAGINCGADCTEVFTSGTVVTLTAAPAVGSTFAGWSGGCSGVGTCVTTINAATTVTATFTLDTFPLTVSRTGSGTGTITSAPAGINCGADCNEVFNYGTAVTLTATPAFGSTFAGWSGACSGAGSCTVTMDTAKSVNANFVANTYTLNVAKAGSGSGTVTSSPAGINCGGDCGETFTHGTVVTLTASAGAGMSFAGWSGGGCTGTGTCVVNMTSSTTVTATFSFP